MSHTPAVPVPSVNPWGFVGIRPRTCSSSRWSSWTWTRSRSSSSFCRLREWFTDGADATGVEFADVVDVKWGGAVGVSAGLDAVLSFAATTSMPVGDRRSLDEIASFESCAIDGSGWICTGVGLCVSILPSDATAVVFQDGRLSGRSDASPGNTPSVHLDALDAHQLEQLAAEPTPASFVSAVVEDKAVEAEDEEDEEDDDNNDGTGQDGSDEKHARAGTQSELLAAFAFVISLGSLLALSPDASSSTIAMAVVARTSASSSEARVTALCSRLTSVCVDIISGCVVRRLLSVDVVSKTTRACDLSCACGRQRRCGEAKNVVVACAASVQTVCLWAGGDDATRRRTKPVGILYFCTECRKELNRTPSKAIVL